MRVTLRLLWLILAVLPASALAANTKPLTAPNHSWITVNGTVTSTSPSAFNLAFDSKSIRVEMDDWDWYRDGAKLLKDQRVTVTGRIDDDVFEQRTIEASTVYVPGLNAYYYANAADEEDAYYPYSVYWSTQPLPDFVAITGRVQDISGREFVLDTGTQDITVDTVTLGYNPLDDEGYQKVDIGDRVRVSGNTDGSLFSRLELNATSVLTLAGS